MTRVARREDDAATRDEPDESPRLAAQRLVERMGMPDLGGESFAAVGTSGAERRIPLRAQRASLSGQPAPPVPRRAARGRAQSNAE